MWDIVRPFAFLAIRHPSSRLPLWINWTLPLLASIVAVVGLSVLGKLVNVFDHQGLLDRLLGFVGPLVGFYIAALAAVSAFNSQYLDRVMPEPAPTMRIKYNGGMGTISLTRRRFLTSMFAYLTALSFLFSLAAIVAITLAAPVSIMLVVTVRWLHVFVLFVFLFALFQMMFITFWGLFYLGERMLTPD